MFGFFVCLVNIQTLERIWSKTCFHWPSLVAQMVKNLPAMWETKAWSLGWEDPLEKGVATHSSILARKSRGERHLVGCSPCGHVGWGRTESLLFVCFAFIIISWQDCEAAANGQPSQTPRWLSLSTRRNPNGFKECHGTGSGSGVQHEWGS